MVPVDAALGLVAGSTSVGLDEVLALLGAQEDFVARAAAALKKLTLVHVCPNLLRNHRAARKGTGRTSGRTRSAPTPVTLATSDPSSR